MRIHPAETFCFGVNRSDTQNGTEPMALGYVAKPFKWSPGMSHDSAKVKYQTWTDLKTGTGLLLPAKSRVWGSHEIEEISISNRWHFILGGYPKWHPSRLANSLVCPWVIPFYKSQGCCMLYCHKDDSKWDKQIHRKCLYNLVLKATGLEIKLSASKFSYIHVQEPQKFVLIFHYLRMSSRRKNKCTPPLLDNFASRKPRFISYQTEP